MLREQKTAKAGCRCEGMLEIESNSGVRSIVALESAERDGANSLVAYCIETILTQLIYE